MPQKEFIVGDFLHITLKNPKLKLTEAIEQYPTATKISDCKALSGKEVIVVIKPLKQ